MAVRARFVEDPDFVDNLLHWRGSLNPVGDKVRSTANRIRDNAKRSARSELAEVTSKVNALASGNRYRRSASAEYLRAKALAYSLRRYIDMLYAVEVRGGRENIGVVAAGHAAGAEIEFGGTDQVLKAGDLPLTYPAYRFLGRSLS